MAAYYLDTSALSKLYVRETGSRWMKDLSDPAQGNEFYTVRIAGPELVAAIMRKLRTGELTRPIARHLLASLRRDWKRRYQIVGVTVAVTERAMTLAEKHPLRGYDAVHVAAALELMAFQHTLPSARITFVSADSNQVSVAAAEGMNIEDPNRYP
ncbi:MAG: type II toxin-antitoxin system VapC family toxin [Caldilineaceae bacterium]|nr:type II toxin-antitoxin system VapC family toxin [Caldilineaceae bacterium]